MLNNIKYIVLSIALIVVSIVGMATFTGCITSPDRDDYKTESCFSFQACMFRNQKNVDKSICKNDSEDCKIDRKIQRRKNLIIYCKDETKRPKGMTYRECEKIFLN